MAFTFVKFPKKYLLSDEWNKPRKYTRAEALLYLVSESELPSIGYLAKVFQWSKSTVHSFVNEMVEQGFIERKSNDLPNENRTTNTANIRELQQTAERKSNDLPNENRTTNTANLRDLQQTAERKSNDLPNENRTHTKEIKNITPLILSSTKVESNIYPPKGELEFLESVDFEFRKIVSDWLAYKRERKESYKSSRSMQAFLAKLKNLSQNNPTIAQEIIQQSMANNWAGIFPLKTETNENRRTANNAGQSARPSTEDLLRAVANGIARARTEQ